MKKGSVNDYDEAAGIVKNDEGERFVEIHEFDMNNMHPHSADDLKHGVKIFIVGKPGFGKSQIIESILLYKGHICPVAQIFSGTENVNHFYRDKSTYITTFNNLDMKAMDNFAKRQNIARQYLENPWAFQVLDDVTDDPYILKDSLFGSYFKKGRHWAMIMINAVQYCMDIPSGLRSCVDYIFLLANGIPAERQKLYDNFASGAIPTYKDFCDIMDQITGDYNALVIDNTNTSPFIKDRVFYFKADISRVPPNFKVGCPDAYDFNEERLNKNYRESFL